MIDLKSFLENKIRSIVSSWHETDIYAISFFLYTNESYEYNGFYNVPEFCISYNTESQCGIAGLFSEKKWNYAFWLQNEEPIIKVASDNIGIKVLFDWYKEKGIKNIGYEDYTACYDNNMNYIGKGPVGYYELLEVITSIARNLQESNFIKNVIGKNIPIIIHDLDYTWYTIEATRIANPYGEANDYLTAIEYGFCE